MEEVTTVSVFLRDLIEKVKAATTSCGEGHTAVKRNMATLSTTIYEILNVVGNAEEKQENDEDVRAWLQNLMDAAHVADGILNRLIITVEPHDAAEQIINTKKMQVIGCIPLPCRNGWIRTTELQSIGKKFKKISSKGIGLGLHEKLKKSPSQPTSGRMSSSEEIHMENTSHEASLQEPKVIVVQAQSRGKWLEDINGLGDLRGELHIYELGNVSSREEAAQALLTQKKQLETLVLDWGEGDRWEFTPWARWEGKPRDMDDEVLKGLQPHANLKNLIIRQYCGINVPSWTGNLEMLKLYSCPGLKNLAHLKHLPIESSLANQESDYIPPPQQQHLLTNLQVLTIINCTGIESIPPIPPSLKELYIGEVFLTELPGLSGSSSSLSSIHICKWYQLITLCQGIFQNRLELLESLTISHCFYLESFPKDGLRHLVSLKSLTLENCNKLTWLPVEDSEGCLPSSLLYLKIESCRGVSIDSFFKGMKNLTSLASLHIIGEPPLSFNEEDHLLLESLPEELLRHLTALEELVIKNCPKLVVFGFQVLPSLRRLNIFRCCNLPSPPLFPGTTSLPLEYLEIGIMDLGFLSLELLRSLTSLKKMIVENCHSTLIGLGSLISLEELCIIDCDELKFESDKPFPSSLMILVVRGLQGSREDFEEGGSDWHKIAHIAYVQINGLEMKTNAW